MSICYSYDVNNLLYMQSGILKRIREKENERDTMELQISNVNISQMDERERKLVSATCSFGVVWLFITLILDIRQIGLTYFQVMLAAN